MRTAYDTLAAAMKDGWLIATQVRGGRDISGERCDGYTYELPNGEQSVLINLTNEPMDTLMGSLPDRLQEELPEPNALRCYVPMFHVSQLGKDKAEPILSQIGQEDQTENAA